MTHLSQLGRHQNGLSAPGWLAVVAIFGFIVITFFKVFPMYYENFQLASSLDSLQKDTRVDTKSKRAMWTSLEKRLRVNDVVSVRREHVSMKRKQGKTTITVSYSTEADWIGNLYIGAQFVETIVIDR